MFKVIILGLANANRCKHTNKVRSIEIGKHGRFAYLYVLTVTRWSIFLTELR